MPVLGHAFVGLTTAVYTRPAVRRRAGAALWVPLLVGLAYLPDISAQLADLAGLGRYRTATHSVFFAVVASALFTGPVATLAGIQLVGAFALVLFSILVHDGLDLFQDAAGYPLWPFSTWHVYLSDRPFGAGLRQEVVWIGGACAALILVCLLVRGLVAKGTRAPGVMPPGEAIQQTAATQPGKAGRRLIWTGYALTAVILLLAAGTHYLCDFRARQLATAASLIKQGRPAEALAWLDQADRWPHGGGPGRVNFRRAAAYWAMGDKLQAEQCYLASLRECPGDYWTLAELARLYAAFPEPLEQRRARVNPILDQLRKNYPNRQDLPATIARIESGLRPPPIRPSTNKKTVAHAPQK